MKSLLRSTALLALPVFLLVGALASAAETKPQDQSAATSDQKAAYPLSTCVVSGDKLDESGKPLEYVYKEAGKPDRLVLLCCQDCVKDFTKDPVVYLKKIDDAAAAKTATK
jgi:hypothetical protein